MMTRQSTPAREGAHKTCNSDRRILYDPDKGQFRIPSHRFAHLDKVYRRRIGGSVCDEIEMGAADLQDAPEETRQAVAKNPAKYLRDWLFGWQPVPVQEPTAARRLLEKIDSSQTMTQLRRIERYDAMQAKHDFAACYEQYLRTITDPAQYQPETDDPATNLLQLRSRCADLHAAKVHGQCIEPKTADNSGNGRQEQRDEASEKPSDMITSSVAIATYQLSRTTLRRAAKEGRLADYRPPGHAPNAPLVVSEAEVAAIWNKRPGATQRP